MPYYESDRALQEVHDEMYRDEEERPQSGFAKLDKSTKFFIGLFVAGVLAMLFMKKITTQDAMMIGGIGALVFFLMLGSSAERRELTWLECMIRIYDLLDFLQQHPIGVAPQIPKGEIRVTPIGRKQWYEGKPFKRSFGVNIYDDERDIEEMYFVEVDVYTGDILTFKHSPEGVRGDETKDIKIMPSYDMLLRKKGEEFMQKRPSR